MVGFLNNCNNYNTDKNLSELAEAISKEKKKPLPDPIETIKKVKVIGCRYKEDDPARGIFFWLYLTGQRVSEMLEVRKYDIGFENTEHGENIIINSISLKNRNNPRRIISIPIYGEEYYMANYVKKMINSIENDEDPIVKYHRVTVFKKLSKISLTISAVNPKTKKTMLKYTFKMHPHYLRHCRASHLAVIYGCDIIQLMNFFGWASPTMPNNYIKYSWKVFAEKFGEKLKKDKEMELENSCKIKW